MKVLVCGAGGFLGSHAMQVLPGTGWTVAGCGRAARAPWAPLAPFDAGDLADGRYVADAMASARPQRILFVAGPASVQASFDDPRAGLAAHLDPLRAVLDAAARLPQPPGVLLVSSAAVYGDAARLPVTEQAPVAPLSPYGRHKHAQEQLLLERGRGLGIPVAVARAFSTYGEGARRLAVWDIATRALHGDYTLRGGGSESRDYLYAQDLAAALGHLLRHAPFSGEIVNVASGHETSIRELAKAIHAGLGIAASPVFDGRSLPGSPLRWRADVSRLRSLGWQPPADALAGLAATLAWIRAHA